MTTAMYAFSGDPITFGHMNVVQRAAALFEHLVVGIGVNANKKYMFDLAERTEMARRSLASIPNVHVVSFPGLLVDYAYENGIRVIIRGVRSAADVDYESTVHEVGRSQGLGIETFFLFADPKLAHVSSSIVKNIQQEQGLIHEYVPLYVKQQLEARMSEQYIVGVTGEIACGKSYVGQKFVELGQGTLKVHNVELDHIGHQILGELAEPAYVKVRQDIANAFGSRTMRPDGTIDRKVLGEVVFNDSAALDKLNGIMYTPLLVRLRRELYGKKGLILFNAALIAESDMSYLCNNNTVLVYADKDTQAKRLGARGLSKEQMERRLGSQYDFAAKKSKLEAAIQRDNQGKIWTIDNSEGADATEILRTFRAVLSELGAK